MGGEEQEDGEEVRDRALDVCMEIVGAPDSLEKTLAENMDRRVVDKVAEDAIRLRKEKDRLAGTIGRGSEILANNYARYETSHPTLVSLKCFSAVAVVLAVVIGAILLKLH
jgi:hypothetical protein